MESLIVRIESRKEWKKVAKKAISLGYIWNGGDTTALTNRIYNEFKLNEKEDVFLFLLGDSARNNTSTDKKGILMWDTCIDTESVDYYGVDDQDLPMLTAKEFLNTAGYGVVGYIKPKI